MSSIALGRDVVETLDGLVSADLAASVYHSLVSPVYGPIGKSNDDDPYPFWVTRIRKQDLSEVPAFGELWGIIDRLMGEGLYDPYNILVNANTFGDCPMVHYDLPTAESTDCYTVLYYAHPRWDANWGGETVLFTEARDDIVRAIYPRPGRILIFDSAIPHVSRAPTRVCAQVRFTVAFRVGIKA